MLSSTRYWSVVALVRRAATTTEVRRRCATSASSSLVRRHRCGVASPSSRSSTISRRSVAAPVAMRQLFASRECDTATQRSESSVSLALDRNDAGSVQSLRLHFHDLTQPAVEVNLMWLRDNCTCAKCLHAITKQRSVDTLSIAPSITLESAAVSDDGDSLLVRWNNTASSSDSDPYHESEYPLTWLRTLMASSSNLVPGAPPAYRVPAIGVPRTLWKAGFQVPRIRAAEVMQDSGLRQWIRWMEEYGAAIITDVPPNAAAAEVVTRRVAPPMKTIFGEFWDIEQQTNSDLWEHCDTAYTNVALKAHTDCTYMYNTPFLQFFQIPLRGGKGGETLLVDGFHVAKQLQAKHPALYYYLSNHPMAFHYIEDDVVLRSTTPTFTHRHSSAAGTTPPSHESLVQFRFNNDDRTPVFLSPEHASVHYEALQALLRIMRAPENEVWMHLSPDELLCTNNWRVLHGRSAFSGRRRLMGCYISVDDYTACVKNLFPASAQQQHK